MKIPIKTNRDFERTLLKLGEKYGEDFEILNGFHESQLNFSDFIDGFIDKNVADVSIDANANVASKDIRSMISEKGKSHDKLFAANKIFYELKKKYGLRTAKEWLETEYNGGFYLHDFHTTTYIPYCYAYDLTRLATEGLFFLKNYNNKPPKHLTTFLDNLIEFISYMSNRSSGAVGIPNVLVWTYYFWKKDCESGYVIKDPDYYMRQNFQKFIYRLNQPFMRIDQTAFVNVSIFDRNYIESLFGGVQYPDGSFVIDHVEELIEHQKAFMEVVSEIRTENMFTFPVLTYSLLYKEGKFIDEEFARWCSDHNTLWNDSNFFMSEDVNTLSNCCFSGDQMTLTKSSEGVNLMSFKDLHNAKYNNYKKNFTIFHNGSWVNGKTVKLPKRKMYKVTTSNKKEFYITDNHINPTIDGNKHTKDLTTNDYLLFNTLPLNTFPEKDKGLTYEQGFLIGVYLGDGSTYDKGGNYTPEIHLSLNETKYNESFEVINKAVRQITDDDVNIRLNTKCNNVYPVVMCNKDVSNFIREYVSGGYSHTKELNMDCLLQSRAFRKGILDGYYLTDGGNSNRIYTTSKNLAYQTETLITSLGLNSIIDVTDRTDEPVIIRGSEFKRNYALYCIRWYDSKNKRQRHNVFKKKNNSTYFKIDKIEDVDYSDDYVYCFEIENRDEPYFTLPNGLITHNCRLLSDTTKLSGFINSIGGTALSIGSVKVNTINLVRIALEVNYDKKKYLKLLKERTNLCCETLDIVRHIIVRNIEKGLLPNYQDGGIELDKQYCTIGILGMYETIESFGLIDRDEFGNAHYSEEGMLFASEIFKVLNDVKDNFVDDYSFNIESVPAERAAIILCQKDNLLFEKDDYHIYSNQWVPLSEKCTIQEKLRVSAVLDEKCSGGAIAHINLDANFSSKDVAWDMLNKIAQSGVIYFAFNTRISECINHHGFVGTSNCPVCGEGVYDTYQRIVGYLVPTRNYSKERFDEFTTREWYEYAELMGD